MKPEDFVLLTALGLLVSSKEAIAHNKLEYVKLATLERDSSSWLISKVVSLPPVQVEQEASSYVLSSAPTLLRTHKILEGDTLALLAQRYQTTVSELVELNEIKNPDRICAGQTLKIPESKSLTRSSTKLTGGTDERVTLKTITWTKKVLTPASLKEIHVSSLIEREKIRPLPPPDPPIGQKNFSAAEPKSKISRSRWEQDAPPALSPPKSPTSLNGASQLAEPISRGESSLMLRPDVDNRIRPHRPINVGRSNLPQQKMRSRQSSRFELVFTSPVQVTPELPPLSVPDELPDAPLSFTDYIWPASGVLTSGYGWRWGRMHKGVDIANAIGTPIMASASGEVIGAGWNNGGYGNLVKLLHADGSVTLYAHNSRVLVRTGQRVSQGEVIAQMGSTGFSTGSHLHFEIHPSGEGAVNPIAYLPR
jgi:murein DD-endopeptidase MepM/ murein hydrolase activator NlpD